MRSVRRAHLLDVRVVGERLQPADFYLQPMADQAELAEDLPEVFGVLSITPVKR